MTKNRNAWATADVRLLWLAAVLMLPQAGLAQGWVPQRHVEVTIPNAQGSSMDIAARTVHRLWQELKLLPVSSTLVNRQGGEQAVAYAYLMQRAGDAHFLSFANPSLLSNHIAGRSTFTYSDFTPIAFLMTDDYIFAVRADHPLKTGKDMVEAVRKRADSVSFGIGTITHRIALGLVLQSAKVDIKQVKIVVLNGGTQTTAALGGHIDVSVSPLGQVLPHLESGKLRVLAVSASKRKEGIMAAVPTWPELGFKEGTYETWRAVIAPRDITPAQVAYWENVLRKVSESDEYRKAAEKNQWDVEFKGAAETRRHMEQEYEQTKSVMQYLGLIK
jgi:putative tricarboxylic transport membrane protein